MHIIKQFNAKFYVIWISSQRKKHGIYKVKFVLYLFFFFLEKLAHLKGYVNNYRDQNKTPKLVSLSENIMHYFLFIVPIMTLLEYI